MKTTTTLADHLEELRSRLFKMAVFVLIFSSMGYLWHEPIINWFSQPLGLPLYYLSPAGGFMLAFNVSLLTGILFSVPVIAYHFARFIAPAIKNFTRRHIAGFIGASTLLAAGGALFAYYITLPAALNFLNDFSTDNISALISAEEYVKFALVYMSAFAIMFQLPLVIYTINRFKPLSPGKLLGAQKVVVVASFVLAAILTPTPDPLNQSMLALPPVALFYSSVAVLAIKPAKKPQEEYELLPKPIDRAHMEPVVIEPDVAPGPVKAQTPPHSGRPQFWDVMPARQ